MVLSTRRLGDLLLVPLLCFSRAVRGEVTSSELRYPQTPVVENLKPGPGGRHGKACLEKTEKRKEVENTVSARIRVAWTQEVTRGQLLFTAVPVVLSMFCGV